MTASTGRQATDTECAPRMPALFSQAVVHAGTVFTSGVVGLVPATTSRPERFADEVEQTLDNLATVLAASGASFGTVVKTTCFLTSRELYDEFNERYGRRFEQPLPARSVVFCELAADLRVEIEAVAAVADGIRG